MDSKKNHEAHAQFAAVLAPLVAAQLGSVLSGELAASAPPPEATQYLAEAALTLRLQFEGALAGECFLVLGSDDARLLVAGAEDTSAEEVLRSALHGLAEPLAAALFSRYGSVRILLAEPAPASEDAVAIAFLRGAAGGNAEFTLALYANGELERGLSRLARVRAAAEASGYTGGNLGLVMDVELNVALRFGERQLSLREVMDLTSGSVVELDREVDEPVELILDGRVIARGEAVIVDGNYGVRVTEVLHPVVL